MSYNIITISREYGSGGRHIGELAAEKLGDDFFDKELIVKAAEKSGFAESFVKEHDEKKSLSRFFSDALSGSMFNGMSMEDYIWSVQRQVILELADKGNCVIVGRCSDYVLRDRANCLNVFVHADKQDKMQRIVEEYGDTKASPEKLIADTDKKRAKMYKYYTDKDWGMASNYHLSLNSSKFGLEKCVEMITELAK